MIKKFIYIVLDENYISISHINLNNILINNYEVNINLKNYELNLLQQIIPILTNYIEKNKIKTKNIFLVLNSSKIAIRLAEFNNIKEKNLKYIVENNYEDYIPVDKSKFIVDYKILNKEHGNFQVMILGSLIDVSDNIVKVFSSTRFSLINIDVVHTYLLDYLISINNCQFLTIITSIDKIWIFYINNGILTNIRETNLSLDNEDELSRFINFEKMEFDIVYIYSRYEWIKEYFNSFNVKIYHLSYVELINSFIFRLNKR